jgi:hypothetical protein
VGGQVRIGPRNWAYIDGACEVQLPAGSITVEIDKGIEYNPIYREVQLAAGQISLRFSIERWADLRPAGWYPGDIRAHELSPHAALLEGAAEGLAVVQVLARERPSNPPALPNLLEFSGTEAALRSDECLVAVNTLNVHSILGTVALLDSHRPVFPLRFGAPGGIEDWSVADWCDQCHRKRGLVVWPDLPRLDEAHPQGEALAALILGKVDAYEVCDFPEPEPENLGHYYRLLDAGLRPVLVGGSGKESNAIPLGAVRTYAQLQPGQSLAANTWIDAVRAGRTFVTNGPLLQFSAAGQGPGSILQVEAGRPISLQAMARSTTPFDHIDLLAGSDLIDTKPTSGNRHSALLEAKFIPEHSTWLAARCHSAERIATGSCVFAHTSPIWVEVKDRPQPRESARVEPLLNILAITRQWVEQQAQCGSDKHRDHLVSILDEARTALLAGLRRS